jgi:hypothetical protein
MKASRLIFAIVGIVASSSCAHLRPLKNPVPYELSCAGNQGDQVIRFLEELVFALRRAPGLAWSGPNPEPWTGPLNRDALIVLHPEIMAGKREHYPVFGRVPNRRPAFDGTVLATSTGACPRGQLALCIEKVVADAGRAGKKLSRNKRSSLRRPRPSEACWASPLELYRRCRDPYRIRGPMTSLTPSERCEACDGFLVPPELLDPTEQTALSEIKPDYVCIRCQRPYCWRGNPPRLVSVRS